MITMGCSPVALINTFHTLCAPRPYNLVGPFTGVLHFVLLAPAVTVGETKGAMDSTSVFFWPLLLPITLLENKLG